MSLTASYVALVVIIIRMLLGKSPKIFSYVIWAVVWFRLVCPVSFESPLSLVPIKSPIPYDITTSTNPMVRFGLRSVDNVLNQSIKSSVPTVNPAASVNPMGVVMEIAAVIWLLGIAVILCYSIVSYSRLKIRLSTATLFKDNIFETDRIKTPFVLGFIRPKIFIPTGLAQKELDYILKHEQYTSSVRTISSNLWHFWQLSCTGLTHSYGFAISLCLKIWKCPVMKVLLSNQGRT